MKMHPNRIVMNEADGEGGDLPGGDTPSWYYQQPTENNAGLGGYGEVPDWFQVDKYKSVEEQAKGYKEAASKLGSFEAAPEEYSLPDNFDEMGFDPGILDIFKSIGKENNMGQNMFNDLISRVDEYQAENSEAALTNAREELGEKADERINDVNNWLNTNAPKDVIDVIAPLATSAEAIKALEFFIGKSKNSKVADQSAQPADKISQSEYAEMLMAKDANGNLKFNLDPAYKLKMDKLAAQFS